jgi:hypothetical protein
MLTLSAAKLCGKRRKCSIRKPWVISFHPIFQIVTGSNAIDQQRLANSLQNVHAW